MCGYVAQLICFPPINSKSGTVNDPSNYLKSQIGKGSNIVLLLRQLPPILSTRLFTFLSSSIPSIFMESRDYAGKTPLS